MKRQTPQRVLTFKSCSVALDYDYPTVIMTLNISITEASVLLSTQRLATSPCQMH